MPQAPCSSLCSCPSSPQTKAVFWLQTLELSLRCAHYNFWQLSFLSATAFFLFWVQLLSGWQNGCVLSNKAIATSGCKNSCTNNVSSLIHEWRRRYVNRDDLLLFLLNWAGMRDCITAWKADKGHKNVGMGKDVKQWLQRTSSDIFMLLMEGETATAAGRRSRWLQCLLLLVLLAGSPPTLREGFLPINTSTLTDSGLHRVALTNQSSGLGRVSTVCAQGLAWTLRDRYVTSLKRGLSSFNAVSVVPPEVSFTDNTIRS